MKLPCIYYAMAIGSPPPGRDRVTCGMRRINKKARQAEALPRPLFFSPTRPSLLLSSALLSSPLLCSLLLSSPLSPLLSSPLLSLSLSRSFCVSLISYISIPFYPPPSLSLSLSPSVSLSLSLSLTPEILYLPLRLERTGRMWPAIDLSLIKPIACCARRPWAPHSAQPSPFQ